MTLPEQGYLLRIFIGEGERHENLPLYEWIVHKAHEQKLAGATAIRGILGFGAGSHLHTAKILRLSADLPIIVEVVDSEKKIENFLEFIELAITEGLATTEKVNVRLYRSGQS